MFRSASNMKTNNGHGSFAERVIMQLFVRGLETIQALEVSQDATIAGVKVSSLNDTTTNARP